MQALKLAAFIQERLGPELNYYREQYGHAPGFPPITPEELKALDFQPVQDESCTRCGYVKRRLDEAYLSLRMQVSFKPREKSARTFVAAKSVALFIQASRI